MNRSARALAGIAFALLAVACFAMLDTTTKYVTASVPLLMALWFRYLFQAVATTVAVWPRRGSHVLRTAHPKFQLLRGALLLASSLFAFACLQFMPVGEFTAVVMVTPLAITLMAATWLNERVSLWRWLFVIGGFAGTLLVIRPDGDDLNWTLLLPLGLVACNASFQALTSRLVRTEDPMTLQFYTGWIGTVLATLALPFVWTMPTSAQQWACLVFMGLTATVGHFLLILAYARAPAATLTPYLYAQIGFAMFTGWVVFSHVPDRWALLGMALVAICGAAGAWVTVRENRAAVQFADT